MTSKTTWNLIGLVGTAIVVVTVALELLEVARPFPVVALALSSFAVGGITQTLLQARKGTV